MYVLKGIEHKWTPRREIKEMGDFLLSNPGYLYPFHIFVAQTHNVSHLSRQLNLAIEEAVILGIISRGAVTNQFVALSTQFMEYDIAKSGLARGNLLEYLCYSRGPFLSKSGVKAIIRFRQCTLQNQKGEVQCGDHNLDVGFADACYRILELQECKYNLTNFLDGSSTTIRKLNYMKCVQQRLDEESFKGQVVLASMQFNTLSEQETLKRMGFNFLIFDFDDVVGLIA